MENIKILGFADPLSSWSHLGGLILSVVGGVMMVYKGRGNAGRVTSLVIFTITLIFLFSMSFVYHLLDRDTLARAVLQRLDHAGIWLLIAGTFTPLHVILFRGTYRVGMLAFVWTVAITGLVLEVVFFENFPEWLALSFFLGLGWTGIFSMIRFNNSFRDPSVKLMIAGALAYSIGAVLDFVRWPILIPGILGPHEIFHIFVLFGAGFHSLFIYHWADHPVHNRIIFHVRIFPDGKAQAEATSERLEVNADNLAELKERIKADVRQKYHESIQPEIHLKYSQEEIIV
jgi:channel protein (hemolysin III family)